MDQITRWFHRSDVIVDLVTSVAILVAIGLLRSTLIAFVRRATFRSDRLRIRWIGAAKWSTTIVGLVGLVVVWGAELKTFAISLAAVGAAFVVAIREVIVCVSGFVINAAGDGFSTGDRIKVNDVVGDVVDLGLFSTTVLEVDAHGRRTGRMVFVPNSVFLTSSLVNETAEGEYVSHTIVLPPVPPDDWRRAERALMRAAEEVTAPYIAAARESLEGAALRTGLPLPDAALDLSAIPAAGRAVELHLRVPVPARRRARIELDVERRFLELFHESTPGEAA